MAVMERVHGRKAPPRSQRHRGTGTADPIPHEPLKNAMNKIYRIVWNATIGKWVVASELATRRGKSGSGKASVKVGVVAVLGLSLAGMSASSWAFTPYGTGATSANTNNTVVGDGANAASASCATNAFGAPMPVPPAPVPPGRARWAQSAWAAAAILVRSPT